MVESGKSTPVVFTGNGTEYFGIWIVNLLLSIITLGIYSAWAKVRRKKYFYNNTLIDGVGFDYHASPISILKGRIIAFILFVIYIGSQSISPIFSGVLLLLFFAILPWLVVRTTLFNARNSSHRGLRFDFSGKLGKAYAIILGLPVVMYALIGAIFFLSVIPYIGPEKTPDMTMVRHVVVALVLAVIIVAALMPLFFYLLNKYMVNGHRFGITNFDMRAKLGSFYAVYLKMFLVGIGMALFVAALAGAAAAITHYAPSAVSGAMKALIFVGVVLVYGVILLVPSAYLKARLGNLIWNTTSLDHLSFNSTLQARGLIWLYFSNFIFILITFGLFTPWAHVRMIRYRIEHLEVLGEADLDRFVGDKKAQVSATGEEIADFFDVDLAFG